MHIGYTVAVVSVPWEACYLTLMFLLPCVVGWFYQEGSRALQDLLGLMVELVAQDSRSTILAEAVLGLLVTSLRR